MDKIANTLKERREELGLSVEDINEKTKLPVQHILALEKGDISYFKEDLSYLQFFVRSYCNALDIDYAEIKGDVFESVESFTQAFEEEEIERRKSMEEDILKNSLRLKRDKVELEEDGNDKLNNKSLKPISRKRIELSGGTKKVRRIEPSVIVLIILLIGVITVLGIKVFNPSTSGGVPDKEPNTVTPLDPQENKEEEEEKEPEKQTLDYTKNTELLSIGELQYDVRGFKVGDVITVSTTVTADCWMDFYLNNQEFNKLDWKIYGPADTISYEITIVNPRDSFKIGYHNNLGPKSILVNGIEIEMDEQSTSATYVTLNFVQGE